MFACTNDFNEKHLKITTKLDSLWLSLRVDLLFKFIITWLLCTSFVEFECVNKHYLVTPTLNETKIMFMFMLIYWLLLCSSHSKINMEIAAYKHFAFTSPSVSEFLFWDDLFGWWYNEQIMKRNTIFQLLFAVLLPHKKIKRNNNKNTKIVHTHFHISMMIVQKQIEQQNKKCPSNFFIIYIFFVAYLQYIFA